MSLPLPLVTYGGVLLLQPDQQALCFEEWVAPDQKTEKMKRIKQCSNKTEPYTSFLRTLSGTSCWLSSLVISFLRWETWAVSCSTSSDCWWTQLCTGKETYNKVQLFLTPGSVEHTLSPSPWGVGPWPDTYSQTLLADCSTEKIWFAPEQAHLSVYSSPVSSGLVLLGVWIPDKERKRVDVECRMKNRSYQHSHCSLVGSCLFPCS